MYLVTSILDSADQGSEAYIVYPHGVHTPIC